MRTKLDILRELSDGKAAYERGKAAWKATEARLTLEMAEVRLDSRAAKKEAAADEAAAKQAAKAAALVAKQEAVVDEAAATQARYAVRRQQWDAEKKITAVRKAEVKQAAKAALCAAWERVMAPSPRGPEVDDSQDDDLQF